MIIFENEILTIDFNKKEIWSTKTLDINIKLRSIVGNSFLEVG